MHLFSPFNAGGIVRARSPALIFFFSFQKSFSTKKEDKKSEENQPSGKISLSLVLSLRA
jgi:hypothetical protein